MAGVEKEFRITRKKNEAKAQALEYDKGDSSSLTVSDGATMRTIGSTVKG